MNWEYTPKDKGIGINLMTHREPVLGFQYRVLGISLDFFYVSLHVFWFDRKEYEVDMELLANYPSKEEQHGL